MDRRLSILLVEDDEDDYIIVRDLLSEVEGWRCELAWVKTYEQALEAMGQRACDVYLVDYRLGTHDGLELLRQAVEQGYRTPVIFLTGQGGVEVDLQAMRAGAADYLVKGKLDASTLERSIRYALERAQTLEALRKSEKWFRSIVQATPIPMVVIRSSDGMVLYANDHFALLLGLAKETLDGHRIAEFAGYFGEGRALLEDLQQVGKLRSDEVQGRRVDGTPFWVNISAQETAFEGEEAILIGLYDLTELKRTQQELLHLERLHTLGKISAGISHNLNNLLVGILGPAQALQRKTVDPRVLELAEVIVTSARRARELVQRFHQAARGREEEIIGPVPLDKVVLEVVRVARPRWKDEAEARGLSIEVVAELEKDLPPIRATWSGLHDILLNLLFNAVDALPQGGRIAIRTGRAGREVLLAVSDDGVGMDEETRQRVFEPFFTTKAGVGTGLGLYTVYGTVNRLGGRVELESAPGRGTCFTFWFPVWTGKSAQKKKSRQVRQGRRGKVLIVDDDWLVRKVLPYLLSEEHEVEAVESGQEALERFAPQRYDVVLIDLGMAGVPGDQLARQMRQIEPSVCTVLITGWEVRDLDPQVSVFDFRLQKPFEDLDEVREVVARAVELRDRRVGKAPDPAGEP